MSEKNYVSYGDAETILTEFASDIKEKVSPGYLKSTVGWTGKNLLPNPLTTREINGVTFTVNSDGSIKMNGTSSNEIMLDYIVDNSLLQNLRGNFIASVGDVSVSGWNWVFYKSTSSSWNLSGSTTEMNISLTEAEHLSGKVRIYIGTNKTFTNNIFYPMIRPADISDSTYEPYHKSVEECKVGWDAAASSVKKNYARITKSFVTENGITWTVNADGTITANGTATANSTFFMTAGTTSWNYNAGTINFLPIGDFILSNNGDGAVNNGNIFIGLVTYDENNNTIFSVTTANGENDLSVAQNGYSYILYIRIANGQTVNNLKFYPMIRPASIENSDYVPYIPDNAELDAAKADKDDLYTDTTLNFGGTSYYKISGFNLATSYENVTLLLRSGGRAVILSVNGNSVFGLSPDAFGLNALSTDAQYNISLYYSRGESDIYVKANSGLAVQQIAGAKKNITLTSTTEGTATAKTTLTIYDVRKKADIIESPTNNNLVAMDAKGNIKDSGKKASDLTPVSATGTVETESTASQAYAIGEHFLRNGKFCTAIAAIASGATLTLNTNYVEGTIADAITNKYNYSTIEHKVGTWIDGSAIYEKTIDFGAMPASTTKNVDAGLPSGAKVIKLFGFTADNSWANVYSLPFADATTGANYNFQMWYTNGNVSVKTTTGQSHMVNSFVTIQYIKSSS